MARPRQMTHEELIAGIAEATRKAVQDTHAAGIWTSMVKDGNIIRVYPDGREEIIRPVQRH